MKIEKAQKWVWDRGVQRGLAVFRTIENEVIQNRFNLEKIKQIIESEINRLFYPGRSYLIPFKEDEVILKTQWLTPKEAFSIYKKALIFTLIREIERVI